MNSVKEKHVSIEELGKKRRLKSLINALETEKVEGLDDLIDEMKNLKKMGFYKKMCDTYDLGDKIISKYIPIDEIKSNSSIINLAKANLSNPKFYMPPFTDLIYFRMFYVIYTFLEPIYYMNSRNELEREDLINIYMGGIDKRIVLALDKFDKISDVPELTGKFFVKLKNVKWQNNESKKLYKKLNKLRDHFRVDIFGIPYSVFHTRFSATENAFILFLSGCSAVNYDRDNIIKEDVVRAYKTYFKLMKTDITKYTAKQKFLSGNGYLICDKCNEYYKLQLGESPNDFIDKCECGGNLIFVENLNEIEEG